MMKATKTFAILILAAGIALAAPLALAASGNATPVKFAATQTDGTASAVVKNFYTTLVGVMKDGDNLGFAGRYKKLEPAIRSAFNLPLMTRFAVGPVWHTASTGEQQQLISAFSDFSVATYASQFTKYDGEQFEVIDQKAASGGGVIVETQLVPGDGSAPVTLNYLMKQDERGAWRIVDVFLDGAISELATRRSEFTSIVERDGIPALVNELDEKSKQMGPS